MIIFFWILLAILVGAFASSRSIGFMGGFLFSLFLSPVIGFIIVLVYDKHDESQNTQVRMLSDSERQTKLLESMNEKIKQEPQKDVDSVIERIEKLKNLKESGALTDAEYETLKNKLLQ